MESGLTLTPSMALVFGLVVFTILMLILEWIRADLVALLIVVVIGIAGLVPTDQLFQGFGGNAVISVTGELYLSSEK